MKCPRCHGEGILPPDPALKRPALFCQACDGTGEQPHRDVQPQLQMTPRKKRPSDKYVKSELLILKSPSAVGRRHGVSWTRCTRLIDELRSEGLWPA